MNVDETTTLGEVRAHITEVGESVDERLDRIRKLTSYMRLTANRHCSQGRRTETNRLLNWLEDADYQLAQLLEQLQKGKRMANAKPLKTFTA